MVFLVIIQLLVLDVIALIFLVKDRRVLRLELVLVIGLVLFLILFDPKGRRLNANGTVHHFVLAVQRIPLFCLEPTVRLRIMQ